MFGWRQEASLRLIRPAPEWESRYVAAVLEYRQAGLDLAYDYPDEGEPFSVFCHRLRQPALRPGQVPHAIFWLVDGRRFIGRICIRLELNENLLSRGGHIGYLIRPSCQRRGYGRRILALGLREARALGLGRVLVTCDADNVASRRIIEANGGRLENQIAHELRFWIDLEG
jgi:predicted acetyltransferase